MPFHKQSLLHLSFVHRPQGLALTLWPLPPSVQAALQAARQAVAAELAEGGASASASATASEVDTDIESPRWVTLVVRQATPADCQGCQSPCQPNHAGQGVTSWLGGSVLHGGGDHRHPLNAMKPGCCTVAHLVDALPITHPNRFALAFYAHSRPRPYGAAPMLASPTRSARTPPSGAATPSGGTPRQQAAASPHAARPQGAAPNGVAPTTPGRPPATAPIAVPPRPQAAASPRDVPASMGAASGGGSPARTSLTSMSASPRYAPHGADYLSVCGP